MLYSSAEERRAAIPNAPGSIPGVAHIFVISRRFGSILVRCTDLNFVPPDAGSAPPDLSFWYDVLLYLAITLLVPWRKGVI